jgi:hypothetical protein
VYSLPSKHLLEYAATERALRALLYRFDCPPAHTLGEYALDLLIDPQRRDIASHALACADCAEELRIARAFFAADAPVAKPHGWRRVVASLFTPTAGAAAVAIRGDARATSAEYHAGAVHVVVGSLPARERGTFDLDGLLLHEGASSEAVAGRDVELVTDGVALYTTRTDDLGNFAFDAVASGTYQLEIHCLDEVVVIEDLRLGRPRPT